MCRTISLFLLLTSCLFAGMVEDVISLKEMGLDEASIIDSVAQGEKLKPADLLKLKKAGFSNELIGKMMKAQKAKPAAASAQPTTIIVQQQQQEEKAGEVQLTVHTDLNGATLKIDGNEVAKTTKGINKIIVPTGKHVIRMEASDGAYEKEVEFEKGQANVLHIFDHVEAPESSKTIYQKFLEKTAREITFVKAYSHKANIKGSDGFVKAEETIKDVQYSMGKSIRIFDDYLTSMVFQGVEHTYYIDSGKAYQSSPKVLFIVYFDESLEIKDYRYAVKRVYENYMETKRDYEQLDRNKAKVEQFNNSNPEPNLAIVFSDRSKKKKTESLTLSFRMSGTIYDITNEGTYAVCPLPGVPYSYSWKREGLDKSASFNFPEGKKVIIAVDMNWIGNQTKVKLVPASTDLSKVTFSNYKSF